ncbi:BglII/BstYI family type II restriction endonuclease [Marinomonas arenicola]|uniref:BglII/BstYI family type II restriction endonuclease n=1 Tax=Marinomonas arenicola TaxID=569601 RepID=A0ABU9G996_9GAMM
MKHTSENQEYPYEIFDYNHATAILRQDFPSEWDDLVSLLSSFSLTKEDILTPGGRKSPMAGKLDGFLYQRGWEERWFNTSVVVDGYEMNTPTHGIDCFKNRIGIEVEWNNKDPFFDRDLNNFRLLHSLNALSVGVIITRCSHLQQLFKDLGKGSSYGASTTHMEKLIPRIVGGGSGGCPVLAIGISEYLYTD